MSGVHRSSDGRTEKHYRTELASGSWPSGDSVPEPRRLENPPFPCPVGKTESRICPIRGERRAAHTTAPPEIGPDQATGAAERESRPVASGATLGVALAVVVSLKTAVFAASHLTHPRLRGCWAAKIRLSPDTVKTCAVNTAVDGRARPEPRIYLSLCKRLSSVVPRVFTAGWTGAAR
jgi:hypothetical protein